MVAPLAQSTAPSPGGCCRRSGCSTRRPSSPASASSSSPKCCICWCAATPSRSKRWALPSAWLRTQGALLVSGRGPVLRGHEAVPVARRCAAPHDVFGARGQPPRSQRPHAHTQVLKELSPLAESVLIIIASLSKDMASPVENYRANAIRVRGGLLQLCCATRSLTARRRSCAAS